MGRKTILILAGFIFIHLFFLFNLKFTAWPEMLAWPYLILKGWMPYRDIAIAHTPLLILDLSLFYKIFGIGVMQLKIYSWLWVVLIDGTLFFVAKKLWGLKTAIISLALYIPLHIFFGGNSLWFDYALSLFGLMIFYAILTKRYAWVGILWALGFFTKQTAFWFLFPAGLLLLGVSSNKIEKVIIGALSVFVIVVLALWLFGILPNFYYWAVKFAIGILPGAAGQASLPGVREMLLAFFPFSILAFALIIDWKRYFVLAFWTVFGILGAFPRWELFHLQPGLPYLAIATSIFILERRRFAKIVTLLIILYLVGLSIMSAKYILRDWHQTDRFLETSVIKTAAYIDSNTKPDEKIFILNSWDSLYALADRLPSSEPLYPQLSWYFNQVNVEENVISDLKMDPPALIIMSLYGKTGLGAFKPKLLTDYIFKYYQITDSVDNNFFILTPNK